MLKGLVVKPQVCCIHPNQMSCAPGGGFTETSGETPRRASLRRSSLARWICVAGYGCGLVLVRRPGVHLSGFNMYLCSGWADMFRKEGQPRFSPLHKTPMWGVLNVFRFTQSRFTDTMICCDRTSGESHVQHGAERDDWQGQTGRAVKGKESFHAVPSVP